METLFDLPDVQEPETIITRYVVVITDLSDGDVSYFRSPTMHSQYDSDTEFIAIQPPIKTRGMKLPMMYKSHHGASKRVSDLYRRHKNGGKGIRIGVEKWTRKQGDSEWTRGS